MKLIIGTVQFGEPYGIDKSLLYKNKSEIKKIFDLCKEYKICYFDTAENYKGVHQILGNYSNKSFKVISKILTSSLNEIVSKVENYLEIIDVDNLEGLLIHDAKNFNLKNYPLLSQSIEYLKKNNLIKNFGVSIYDPSELNNFRHFDHIDIIQAPYNILDRRIENSKFIEKLKINGTQIHARSVFLQGLLLRSYKNIPDYFNNYDNFKPFNKYHEFLKSNDLKQLDFCLSFVKNNKFIDKFIVGINSYAHLEEIVINLMENNFHSFPDISTSNLNIIDPSLWKI